MLAATLDKFKEVDQSELNFIRFMVWPLFQE